MRITRLHLQNLNSLKGKWSIDFTAPEFEADGIFAITGPTGAGKSTLLDGICLALFGQTPRLGRVTRANNEIMSRSTGECFAEVEFETSKGRYRCHWSQHRARRSAKGDLQQHKHEIVDATTGKVMETKVREVGVLVEKLTGLDFDQFTRSMLLAQGEFAAFLNAAADERAPILEQITGTEIYSLISIKVHERTAEERRKTDMLKAEIGAVAILSEEEEKALRCELQERKEQAAKLRNRVEETSTVIHLVNSAHSVETELAESGKLMDALKERFAMEQGNLHRYERGTRAQKISSEIKQLRLLREQCEEGRRNLQESEKKHKELLEKQEKLKLLVADRKQALKEHKKAFAEISDQLKTVRTLDTRIDDHSHLIRKGRVELKQLNDELAAEQKQCMELAGSQEKLEQAVNRLNQALEIRQADALLIEHFSAIKSRLSSLLDLNNEEGRLENELTQLNSRGKRLETESARAQQAYNSLEAKLRELAAGRSKMEQQRGELLKGRDSTELRAETEQLKEKEQLYTKLIELITGREKMHLQVERVKNELDTRLEKEAATAEKLAITGEQEAATGALIKQLEKTVRLQERIIDLEAERKHLEKGRHCPLCGSREHPWAVSEPDTDNDDREALQQARARQEETRQSITVLRETAAGLKSDIEHSRQLLAALQHDIRTQDRSIDSHLEQLGISDRSMGLNTLEERLATHSRQVEENRRLLNRLDRLDTDLHQHTKLLEQRTAEHREASRLLQECKHAQADNLKEQQQVTSRQIRVHEQVRETILELEQQLAPLGIEQISRETVRPLIDDLGQRKQERLNNLAEKQRLTEASARQRTDLERAKAKVEGLSKETASKTQNLQLLQETLATLREERTLLFGDRQVDREEKQYIDGIEQAQKSYDKTVQDAAQTDTSLHGLEEAQRAGREHLEKHMDACTKQESFAAGLLMEEGFTDLTDFDAAVLSKEETAILGALKASLEHEQSELEARIREKTADLKKLKEKLQDHRPLGQLEKQRQAMTAELEELQQQIGAAVEKTAKNEAVKKQLENQHRALVSRQQEEERWNRLHQLIGSADGKKFRVFAQGITFDRVIHHANHHLEQMNDRYILLRDQEHPLELLVIDNYQAGEVRSTKNLSGGESFIVSLALSLGLSSMVSHNIQVDSLFLDEGFGTLDEEALDTALHTLAALRRNGKLIGVISHVPMLRERIGLQVEVHPKPDGFSTLMGPGCRKED